MSVQSQIERIGQNVTNTYAVLDALGADMPTEQNSDNLAATAGTAKAVLYSEQSLTATQQAQARSNLGVIKTATPQDYGAMGDGSTDDTAAFQAALAENRVVYVPGGTYKLNGTLVIRQNCCMEMAQDTILEFENTSGNCIEVRSSGTLRGNFGTINVPYAFTGHVIDANSTHETATGIPPYTKWTPMWKHGRYIYDICIVKATSDGVHISADGKCSGTGIYLSGDGNNEVRFIWGALLQGIRIGGAFERGIHAINFDLAGKEDSAWNHDMRIEAVIHGCEIGVDLTNCNDVHLAVAVQPKEAVDGTTYAKWGVYLNDCRYIDMSSSVIWDWDASNSLYTPGGEYTTVAMYGNCCGLVYNDFGYYSTSKPTRDRIYTDTPSNLEKMTIMQEPIDKWFKVKDGTPYYHYDNADRKLALNDDLVLFESHFDTNPIKNFTDVLPNATDTDGSIYNGIGYKKGGYIAQDGAYASSGYYACTGFIPCKKGDEIHIAGMNFTDGDNNCRIVTYDSEKTFIAFYNRTGFIPGNNYTIGYTETDNGCVLTLKSVANNNNVAFIRFSVFHNCISENPMVAINDEIKYTMAGFLADEVKVKSENVILQSPDGTQYILSVGNDGNLTATPRP